MKMQQLQNPSNQIEKILNNKNNQQNLSNLDTTQEKYQNFYPYKEEINLSENSKQCIKKQNKKKITIQLSDLKKGQIKKSKQKQKFQLQSKPSQNSPLQNWNDDLGKKMLYYVSKGLKWRQIANNQQFKILNISSCFIKIKFQCFIHFKWNILYHLIYHHIKTPNISDLVFKFIIQQHGISSFSYSNLLSSSQKQALINSIQFFKFYPHQFTKNKLWRNKQTINVVINYLSKNLSLQLIINTILKLNEFQKNKKTHKYIKLNQLPKHQQRTFPTQIKPTDNTPFSINIDMDEEYPINNHTHIRQQLFHNDQSHQNNSPDSYEYFSFTSSQYPFQFSGL